MADPLRTSDSDSTPISSRRGHQHDPEAHPYLASPDPTGRRKFVRTNISLTVSLRSEGVDFEGTTENLSPGGVFVCTNLALQVGETVDLLITMPNQTQITAHGVIRWTRPDGSTPKRAGLGIQFLQLEGGSMMGPFDDHK